MHDAYEDLPSEIKNRLAGMTATHNFEKFWEQMRRSHGSERPAMTDEQRRRRPPVVHPVFLAHPITGRKVLYCNPGYTVRINELPQRESDEMLEYLFAHQLQTKFRYTHVWTENDLLLWDHLGTIHRAIADYRLDEIRLIRRCQVMATKVFDPAFLRPARELAAAETA
jgi:taurine dioxygenase